MPRARSRLGQRTARDYDLQFAEPARHLRPRDHVSGTAVARYAVASAGAPLYAHREEAPMHWRSSAAPARHRRAVLDEEPFASQDYVHELRQSTQLR